MKTTVENGIPLITPENLRKTPGVRIVDVRTPEEFVGELGHIEGAVLVTLGPELSAFLRSAPKDDPIVFVCRSGARSGNATLESLRLGFKQPANMVGGMIRWNAEKFPVERN